MEITYMKDIAKKYEKKHVIECHNVPDIDMNKQDGGLPHMAGVYTYRAEMILLRLITVPLYDFCGGVSLKHCVINVACYIFH